MCNLRLKKSNLVFLLSTEQLTCSHEMEGNTFGHYCRLNVRHNAYVIVHMHYVIAYNLGAQLNPKKNIVSG